MPPKKQVKKTKKPKPPKVTKISQKQTVNIKIGDTSKKSTRRRRANNKLTNNPTSGGSSPYAEAVSQKLLTGPIAKPELPPIIPSAPPLLPTVPPVLAIEDKPKANKKFRGKAIKTGSRLDNLKIPALKEEAQKLGINIKKSWNKQRILEEMYKKIKPHFTSENNPEPKIDEPSESELQPRRNLTTSKLYASSDSDEENDKTVQINKVIAKKKRGRPKKNIESLGGGAPVKTPVKKSISPIARSRNRSPSYLTGFKTDSDIDNLEPNFNISDEEESLKREFENNQMMNEDFAGENLRFNEYKNNLPHAFSNTKTEPSPLPGAPYQNYGKGQRAKKANQFVTGSPWEK